MRKVSTGFWGWSVDELVPFRYVFFFLRVPKHSWFSRFSQTCALTWGITYNYFLLERRNGMKSTWFHSMIFEIKKFREASVREYSTFPEVPQIRGCWIVVSVPWETTVVSQTLGLAWGFWRIVQRVRWWSLKPVIAQAWPNKNHRIC